MPTTRPDTGLLRLLNREGADLFIPMARTLETFVKSLSPGRTVALKAVAEAEVRFVKLRLYVRASLCELLPPRHWGNKPENQINRKAQYGSACLTEAVSIFVEFNRRGGCIRV